MMWVPELSSRSMEHIFRAILSGFLNDSKHKELPKFANLIVKATVDLYNKIIKELLPTPVKSHYTFNLRDVSKVFQGMLQINIDTLSDKDYLIQLWVHECCRTFHDRLVNE